MMRYPKINLTFVTLVICCLIPSYVSSQTKSASAPILVNAGHNEDSQTQIALLSQSVDENETIILIARLGNGESSRRLSRRRLQAVHEFLPVVRGLKPPLHEKQIVLAAGERVRGLGRIEAYIRGRLFMVFMFERNKNFAPEA